MSLSAQTVGQVTAGLAVLLGRRHNSAPAIGLGASIHLSLMPRLFGGFYFLALWRYAGVGIGGCQKALRGYYVLKLRPSRTDERGFNRY